MPNSFLLLLGSVLLLFPPSFAILVQNLKSIRSPIRSTEWTLKWFSVSLVVLEATLKTVCMYLPTTTVQTMRKIFSMSKSITANTTCLIIFQGTWWYFRAFRLLFLSSSNSDASVTDRVICISSYIFGIQIKLCVSVSVAFIFSEQPLRLPVLVFDTRRLHKLPLSVGFSISQELPLSPLQYLLYFCLGKCQLPDQWITLVYSEYFQKRINGVDAVFCSASST